MKYKIINREKRVTICFIGGLGNNLFQIALGKFLEEYGYKVKFDLSMCKKLKTSKFSFLNLQEYVEPRIIELSRFWPSPNGKFKKFARLVRFGWKTNLQISDYSSLGCLISPNIDSSFLIGYWQRLTYTEKLVKDLKQFQNADNLSADRVLSIHVRRGDMLETSDVLPDQYYRQAVNQVIEKFGVMKIRVVTDDLEYCKNYFYLDFEFEVVSNEDFATDFEVLRQSSHLILSRSTFSWWAARLSNASIFYPSPWNLTKPETEELIIPETWIPVKVSN